MMVENHTRRFENMTSKKLFLVDGLGALLSAIMLGVALVKLEHIFGIPRQALYILAAIPCLFLVYDIYGYKIQSSSKARKLLEGIAYMNIAYCILSIGLAFYHIGTITTLGWTYIVIEILIILGLVIVELRVAKQS